MDISILQANLTWAEPDTNRRHLEAMIDPLNTDMIVMPEMFSTGFVTCPDGIAEKSGILSDNSLNSSPESLVWMRKMAAEKNAAIAGSIAVEEGGRFYNRFYFVFPDGRFVSYNKHHLFTYGGEDRTYTAGKECVVVTFQSCRILLQTCYDLRFPVFSRNAWLGDHAKYDMALYVASWPDSRSEAWKTLLKARAIENQCFVVGVNRVGNDPACSYSGDSAVIDPYGKYLAQCTPYQEETQNADINLEELARFRQKFPVLLDADKR